MFDLKKLTKLDLSGLQIELDERIGELTELRELDLRGARITRLPDSIGALTNLEDLDLVFSGVQSLPESFYGLPLKRLRVQYTALEKQQDVIQARMPELTIYK